MTFDADTLRERLAEKPGRGSKKVWVQPEIDDFAYGAVLAFDQTLTKTGWVLLAHRNDGIRIHAGGVLLPPVDPALKSFERTFAKADAMGAALERTITAWKGSATVVHEMPAVIGYRIESSLMAAREIRRATLHHYAHPARCVMIARQAAYATLTGAPSTDKRHMTAAVNRLIPEDKRKTERWTQDVHDAAGLALKHLYDEKRAQA